MSAHIGAKRILLLGYYGFGNAGDEAVLAGLISSFRIQAQATSVDIDIGVLSIDPESTTRDHGVKAFHRYKLGELISALQWCDLLAEGGGSLLQDITSARSIYYYLWVLRLAQMIGKKTMFIAQGIGPLNNRGSRRFTASVARRCNAVIVRDTGSADLLAEIGVPQETVTVTADPALILGNLSAAVENPKEVFVSLRPWKDQDHLIAHLADVLRSSSVQRLHIAPLACASEDVEPLKTLGDLTLLSSLQNAKAMTYSEIIQAMRETKLVIGMRLHSLILAASCGVPSLALSYDPKVREFMEQSGQGDAVFDIKTGDTSALAVLLDKVLSEAESRRAALHKDIPGLVDIAQRNGHIAVGLACAK